VCVNGSETNRERLTSTTEVRQRFAAIERSKYAKLQNGEPRGHATSLVYSICTSCLEKKRHSCCTL